MPSLPPQIGGTLPAAFGKPGALPHLRLLNVWGNQLSGTLPAAWWAPLPSLCTSCLACPKSLTPPVAYTQVIVPIEDVPVTRWHMFPCMAQDGSACSGAHHQGTAQFGQARCLKLGLCWGGRGADGSLAALSSVYVSQNQLHGPVPPEWSQPGRFAPLTELLLMSSGGGVHQAAFCP